MERRRSVILEQGIGLNRGADCMKVVVLFALFFFPLFLESSL
jgi:hypothetical protein